MRLARTRRARGAETILPLIDVVFFLLVFFLLIGRMDATAPFEVAPSVSTSGRIMPGGGATVAVGHDGQLALDGDALAEDAVLDALRRRAATTAGLVVRINAHRDAELRFVLPLAGRIRAAGVDDLVLVVTPEDGGP
jgi:biopolymer transport protein ExbD